MGKRPQHSARVCVDRPGLGDSFNRRRDQGADNHVVVARVLFLLCRIIVRVERLRHLTRQGHTEQQSRSTARRAFRPHRAIRGLQREYPRVDYATRIKGRRCRRASAGYVANRRSMYVRSARRYFFNDTCALARNTVSSCCNEDGGRTSAAFHPAISLAGESPPAEPPAPIADIASKPRFMVHRYWLAVFNSGVYVVSILLRQLGKVVGRRDRRGEAAAAIRAETRKRVPVKVDRRRMHRPRDRSYQIRLENPAAKRLRLSATRETSQT
jgi:hypothetical protein